MAQTTIAGKETDYYLGPVLGRGITGFVYEGFRRSDGREVVFKVLSRKLERFEDVVNRAKEFGESFVASGLRSPRVARPLDFVKVEGRVALVQERAPGLSLAEVLTENGPVTDRRAMKLALQVVKGLLPAARRGLHHGDLRPARFYVNEDGKLWVTDFGMAELSCIAHRFRKYARLPFGHPEYLAPELVQDGAKTPTEQGDIYAVGVSLYEMVCGVPPFRGNSARDTLHSHLEDCIPPPPRGINVFPGLADLILELTAKDPRKRPDSLEEVQRRLKALLRGKKPGECSISPDEWTQMSGVHAIGLENWDADRLDPAQSQGVPSDEKDALDEDILPPGDFTGDTGFYKRREADEAAAAIPENPFDEERRMAAHKRLARSIGRSMEELDWEARSLLLGASLVVNLVLGGLIVFYGLGGGATKPQSEGPPSGVPKHRIKQKGWRESGSGSSKPPRRLPKKTALGKGFSTDFSTPAKPTVPNIAEDLARDRALLRAANAALDALDELEGKEAKALVCVDGRIWFNIAGLPKIDAYTEKSRIPALKKRRAGLVAAARAAIEELDGVKGCLHAGVDDLKQELSHKRARDIGLRVLLLDIERDVRLNERARHELSALEGKVEKSPDAYFLAVGFGALGDVERSYRWLNEAILRGFRNLKQLDAEPYLAGTRADARYAKLRKELGLSSE